MLGMQRPAACKRACRKAACPTLRCDAQSTLKHLTHAALRCPSICCAAACPLTHAALRCAAGEGNAAAVRPPQGLQPGHGPQHGQLQGALGALRCAVPAWPHRWMVADTAVGRGHPAIGTPQGCLPQHLHPNPCLAARPHPTPTPACLASRLPSGLCVLRVPGRERDRRRNPGAQRQAHRQQIPDGWVTPSPSLPPCPGGRNTRCGMPRMRCCSMLRRAAGLASWGWGCASLLLRCRRGLVGVPG